MKKPLFLLSLMLLSVQSFAQDSTSVIAKWELGVNTAVAHTYRILSTKNSDQTTLNTIAQRNADEKQLYTLNYGFSIRRNINTRFSLLSGIEYQTFGYHNWVSDLIGAGFVDPRQGFIQMPASTIVVAASIDYRFDYLSVPLMASYRIGNQRWNLTANAGWYNQILMGSTKTIHETFKDGHQVDVILRDGSNSHSFNLAPAAGLQLAYSLNNHSAIQLHTMACTQMLNVKRSNVLERHYAFSAGFGFVHSF